MTEREIEITSVITSEITNIALIKILQNCITGKDYISFRFIPFSSLLLLL